MLLKGPVKDGEYGSAVPVKLKQRPQASPGPRPVGAPKASWFIAAVNPYPVMPQATIVKKQKKKNSVIGSSQMRAVVIITSRSTTRVHGKGCRTRAMLKIIS